MSVFFQRRGAVPDLGKRASDYAVGESVFIPINGTPVEHLVVNQGIPSSLYDASCDGTWLMTKDIYESRAWHSSNVNDYGNSDIHAYLNSTFLGLFDAKAQSIIKQVKIPYVNGTSGSAISSGANGLSAKVFLPSGYELGWTSADHGDFPQDGASLSYFKGATNAKRIAYLNGTALQWWMRSPHLENTQEAWVSSTSGGGGNSYLIYNQGIRPCIVLPYVTRFDSETNIIK